MKTKDVLTWGLILYGIYKLMPTLWGQDAQRTALDKCSYGPMTSTLTAPPWARRAGQPYTHEGEQ